MPDTLTVVTNPYHVQNQNGEIVGYQKDGVSAVVFTPRLVTTAAGVVTGPMIGAEGAVLPVFKGVVTNAAATYVVLATDHTIIQTTAASTYTLPSAVTNAGRVLHIVTQFAGTVVSATSNVVPIAGTAAGTPILAATAGKFATLQSNGVAWVAIASN